MIGSKIHKYIGMLKNFSNFNPYLCDVMTFTAVISEVALEGKLKIACYKDVLKKEIYELTGDLSNILSKTNKNSYQLYSEYYKKYPDKFDKFLQVDEASKQAVINKAIDKFKESKLDKDLAKNYVIFDKSTQGKLESDRTKIKDELIKFGDSISQAVSKLIASDDYKVAINSNENNSQWLANKLTKIADNIKSRLGSRYKLEVSIDELSIIITPKNNEHLRYVIQIGYDLSKNVTLKHSGIEV